MLASSGSGSATDALLGDYTDRPLPTPMRTRMGSGASSQEVIMREVIMRETSKLRMLERGQTPLLGGMNPALTESEDNDGVNLSTAGAATPMIGK